MMTTGDLYVEGSVTTFNNPYFTEGTGTVHIGKDKFHLELCG